MLRLISLSAAMLAVLAALPGPLAHAAGIEASLDGFIKLQYGLFGQADNSDKFRPDIDTHLDLSETSDTGIAYSGRVQLIRAAKPRDNGTDLAASAAWGDVRLGDSGGAVKELMVSAPTVGIGQIDGDFDVFAGPSALLTPYKLDNDDSTRLTYLSPIVAGIRLGLSYAPELASAGVEAVPARHPMGADAHRNLLEVAANYTHDIGETTLTAGAAYVHGAAKQGSPLRDLSGYGVGAHLAWNGFTFGGGFVYDGKDTLPLDRRLGHTLIESVISEINLGLTYEDGAWGFGTSWAHDYRAGLSSSDLVSLGASYRVAHGFTLGTDVIHFTEPKGQGEAEGYGLIVQAAYRFGLGLGRW